MSPNAAIVCRHDSTTLPNCRLQTINPHNTDSANGASSINRRVGDHSASGAYSARASFSTAPMLPAPASAPHTQFQIAVVPYGRRSHQRVGLERAAASAPDPVCNPAE